MKFHLFCRSNTSKLTASTFITCLIIYMPNITLQRSTKGSDPRGGPHGPGLQRKLLTSGAADVEISAYDKSYFFIVVAISTCAMKPLQKAARTGIIPVLAHGRVLMVTLINSIYRFLMSSGYISTSAFWIFISHCASCRHIFYTVHCCSTDRQNKRAAVAFCSLTNLQ